MSISFSVNGRSHEVGADRAEDRLIDFLHDDLNLTGTKFCCGIGVCLACTVSMTKPPTHAATPVIACSTPLALVAGAAITTVEGVGRPGVLLPVQGAFLHHFAFQCGYCTPGFVMAAQIFLDALAEAPVPVADLDAAIERAIGAHICRCTGYVRYAQALRETALAIMAEGGQ